MADDNNIARAREVLSKGEMEAPSAAELEQVLAVIDRVTEAMASRDLEIKALRAAQNEDAILLERADAKIRELLPENPLGNMNVGATYQ